MLGISNSGIEHRESVCAGVKSAEAKGGAGIFQEELQGWGEERGRCIPGPESLGQGSGGWVGLGPLTGQITSGQETGAVLFRAPCRKASRSGPGERPESPVPSLKVFS